MISRRAFMQALAVVTTVALGRGTIVADGDDAPAFVKAFEEGDVIFIPIVMKRQEGISWSPEGGSLPTYVGHEPAVTCEIECRVFTGGKEPIFEYRGSRYNRNELFAEVSWRSLQGKPI